MKKKLSRNNLKYIILVFIFLIGIGTFLVRESFAIVDTELMVDPIDGGGGGGGYIPPPPPPPPTINVYVSASPTSVYSGSSGSTISWTSTGGATSCSLYRSDTGATVSGLANLGSYPTGSLTFTTTFTVNCSTVAYCSGTYTDFTTKVSPDGTCISHDYGYMSNTDYSTGVWTANPYYFDVLCDVNNNFPWVEEVYYNKNPAELCLKCENAGVVGYKVTGSSWYQPTCVKNQTLGICFGVRWSDNAGLVRSSYATKSCSDLSQSSCSTMTGCTWHP